MAKGIIVIGLVTFAGVAYAVSHGPVLPEPDYQPHADDPDWLQRAAQFHGHLGPWVIIGVRAGLAGRQAVGARGYFDLTVECQMPFKKPPQTCMLDGLQVATGATYGKRNLMLKEAEQLCVVVTNVETNASVRIRLTDRLLALVSPANLGRGQVDRERLERTARLIAAMSLADAFIVEQIQR